MLSSMVVIRSAAEDSRLPGLGLREGQEKGNHLVAQDGVHAMNTLAAECALSQYHAHSVCININIASLSVGPSVRHATNPWDRHGFYCDECK